MVALKGHESVSISVRRGHADGVFSAGDDVVIAIRPEQVVVGEEKDAGNGNVLRAMVADSHFLGDCHEYTVSFGSHACSLTLSASRKFAAGEQLVLKLAEDKMTLWAGESAKESIKEGMAKTALHVDAASTVATPSHPRYATSMK
jgi:ABC-type sugar transport system ATPase subunit